MLSESFQNNRDSEDNHRTIVATKDDEKMPVTVAINNSGNLEK